jgi:hypothetical protein
MLNKPLGAAQTHLKRQHDRTIPLYTQTGSFRQPSGGPCTSNASRTLTQVNIWTSQQQEAPTENYQNI